jgi:hypothetical protein
VASLGGWSNYRLYMVVKSSPPRTHEARTDADNDAMKALQRGFA